MAIKKQRKHGPGLPDPIGATCMNGGVNFSLYSHLATGVELILFSENGSALSIESISLDPLVNKSSNYWHIFLPNISAGQLYGYRIHGIHDPENGLHFDPSKIVIDPYARAIIDLDYDREIAKQYGVDNQHACLKCVVVDSSGYDWEGDRPLNRPLNVMVIYEMHVRGFTMNPNSGVPKDQRGTYAGLIKKIPYLKKLGVQCVQLMPVFSFDYYSAPKGHINYWGYQPIGFFSPHHRYSADKRPMGAIDEFKDMVKALHKAGIEVILDVVYNHTAEESENGPTQSFRGIDNLTYYQVDPEDRSTYMNFSGTGNSINANHSVVRRMILDSLKYWVREMHVDGFRFDLASVLSRGEDNQPLRDPPILWSIDSDPALVHTKIIAEAWDAGGLYQVGCFVGDRWAVLNGHYRDTVRKFLRGDQGVAHELADVLTGSVNLFGDDQRDPQRSINFITSHDGFTMNDLVSYNQKHNEANGEDNRDGENHNISSNNGIEGETDDPVIQIKRKQQIKNFFTLLILSQGPPLITMGDEIRRSLGGNNNPYTLDNTQNWFDWDAVEKQAEIFNFLQELLFKRTNSYIFTDTKFWTTPGGTEVIWHGIHSNAPDFGAHSNTLAMELYHDGFEERFYAIINAYSEGLDFELPKLSRHLAWGLLIDTYNDPPEDIIPLKDLSPLKKRHYHSRPHSVTILRTIHK